MWVGNVQGRKVEGDLTDLVWHLSSPVGLSIELHGGHHVFGNALKAGHVTRLEEHNAGLDAGHVPILGCVSAMSV